MQNPVVGNVFLYEAVLWLMIAHGWLLVPWSWGSKHEFDFVSGCNWWFSVVSWPYVCKLFLVFSIMLQAWIQPGFSCCHLAPWFCCQGYRKFCYNLAIRVWTFYSISWSLLLWKKSLLVLGTKQGGCCSSFEFRIPEQLSFLCGIWVDIWIAKGKRKKKKKKISTMALL